MDVRNRIILVLMALLAFIYNSYSQACLSCSANDSLNLGLVLCLPLNGNPNDESSARFQGVTMNNPAIAKDRFGKPNTAYSFNGINQFIRLGDVLDSVFCKSPAASFSITGWASTASINQTFGAGLIIAKQAGGSGPDQWSISHFNDSTIRGIVKTSPLWDYLEWKSAVKIGLNQWFFFTLMFDGSMPNSMDRVMFFVNGQPTVFSRMNGTFGNFCANSNQEITIGAGHMANNPSSPINAYSGLIDDIRIYNRLLSPKEIMTLYQLNDTLKYTKSSDTQICYGDSVSLFLNGGEKHIWSDSNGILDSINKTIVVCPVNNSYYKFTITKGNCSIKDSIAILLKNTPANAGPDKTICPGDSMIIGVNGPWAALWQPAQTLNNFLLKTPFAKPDSSVSYILRATENGCTSFDSMKVNVVDSLTAFAGSDTTICFADSVRLTGTGGTSYLWQPASLTANSNAARTMAFVPSTTTFILKSSSGSCIAYDSVTIGVSAPKAAFTASALSGFKPLPVTFTNNSVAVFPSYLWDFGDNKGYSNIANPVYTYSLSGNFRIRLIVKDSLGCMDTAYSYIDVAGTSTIFIPNAFSPNSDTNNDLFFPVYDSQFYTKVKGSIWNRWGECIHEFESPVNNWWSGKHKDKECPSGAYLYIMDFTDVNNNTQRFEGFITLIR